MLCPSSSRCKEVRGQPQRDRRRTSSTMCTCEEIERGTHACRASKLGPVARWWTQDGKLGTTMIDVAIQDPPPESGRRTHLLYSCLLILHSVTCLKICHFTACFTSLWTSISIFYVNTARDVVTALLIFAKYLSLYLPNFSCTYWGTHTQARMYNQHTRGMATTRHRSLVERDGRKSLLETLHTKQKNVGKKQIFTNLKENIRAISYKVIKATSIKYTCICTYINTYVYSYTYLYLYIYIYMYVYIVEACSSPQTNFLVEIVVNSQSSHGWVTERSKDLQNQLEPCQTYHLKSVALISQPPIQKPFQTQGSALNDNSNTSLIKCLKRRGGITLIPRHTQLIFVEACSSHWAKSLGEHARIDWSVHSCMFPGDFSSVGRACFHIYIYMYIHLYIFIYTHTHVYIYICIHTYIYIFIVLCIYMYVRIHMYVYTFFSTKCSGANS